MHEEYSNPTIPEGINTSERHLLRSFLRQSLLMLAVFAALALLLGGAATLAAPHLPFAWEERAVNALVGEDDACRQPPPPERELRRLAARIADAMQLPGGMHIRVSYNAAGVVNAFAAPGGRIVVFRGILEKLENEDELAALLAHEIAHVQHRDVARSALRALGIALLFGAVEPIAPALSLMEQASTLSFSRTQEAAADRAAATALARLYGHTGGAVRLFERLRAAALPDEQTEPPELLASHPAFDSRIADVQEHSRVLGVPSEGAPTPMPAALTNLSAAGKDAEEAEDSLCKK